MLKSKKGFSLVELIVVIAIMAVLVGVLAPALMSNVEKSRAQKDDSAMSEVAHAVELALADESIYDEVGTWIGADKDTGIITLNASTGTVSTQLSGTGFTNLNKELKAQIGESVKLTSKTHKAGPYYVTVVMKANEAVKVTGSWEAPTATGAATASNSAG